MHGLPATGHRLLALQAKPALRYCFCTSRFPDKLFSATSHRA